MRLLRIISLFCVALLLLSVQCRAKCVAAPDTTATTAKHPPSCPLHKQQSPAKAKCAHAPQWDADDIKKLATAAETAAPTFELQVSILQAASITVRPTLIQRVSPNLRI